MKAKTPPTSPKYKVKEIEKLYKDKNMKIEKPPRSSSRLLVTVTAALIVGFLAGFFGHIIFDYLGVVYPDRFGTINQSTDQNTATDGIKKNSLQAELFEKVSPSVVDIYVKKEKTEDTLEGVYLESEKRGSGLILSSDGYIITTDRSVSEKTSQYVIITHEQEIYDISTIYEDPATSLVFLKASGAENLKVAQTRDFDQLLIGEDIFSVRSNNASGLKSIIGTNISSISYKRSTTLDDLIKSTEELDRYLFTDKLFDSSWEGSPLIDKNGKVIGLYSYEDDYNNLYVPIDYIIGLVSNLLNEDKVIRTYLGLSYIDLQEAVNISEALSQEEDSGVLIYSSENEAVKEDSPAEKAGLVEGDIVKMIEQTNLSKENDFSEIIQNFNIGDKVIFKVIREGVEREISVTLEKY